MPISAASADAARAPSPFTAWGVLWHTVVVHVRGPLLLALATQILFPAYTAFCAWLRWTDDTAVLALIMAIAHTGTYLVANGFFMTCDWKGFLQEYKLPRKKSQIPSATLQFDTVRTELLGQLISPLLAWGVLRILGGFPPQDAPLPPLLHLWFHYAAATFTNEVLFYAAHRLFHESTFLYQKVHKQHHQYIGTVSVAAEWAAFPEQILANTLPTMLYVVATRQPAPIVGMWMFQRLWETYEAHSGYCFRDTWMSKAGLLNAERAEFHDHHHTVNVGNYGALWLDYLFGTMDNFTEMKSKKKS